MVEAGPTLAASFLQMGLVDELHLFQAPVLLGAAARPLLQMQLQTMAEAQRLELAEQRQLGSDQYLVLKPR